MLNYRSSLGVGRVAFGPLPMLDGMLISCRPPVCVRTSHGGVHWDAEHGGGPAGLQHGEGAQPELCHPAVHQRLPSGGRRRQPQGADGENI